MPCRVQVTWTSVRFPQKGTVFDYYVNWKGAKFAPWWAQLAAVACWLLPAYMPAWVLRSDMQQHAPAGA